MFKNLFEKIKNNLLLDRKKLKINLINYFKIMNKYKNLTRNNKICIFICNNLGIKQD